MEPVLDPYLHLPEAILIFIISMLPLRDAMRTSALSKSWYMLWTYTNSIDFDEKYFSETRYEQQLVCSGRSARTNEIKKVRRRRFIESVCHTLYRMRAENISKFELKFCYKPKYHDFIYQWIAFSMEKNIEELHLDFSTRVLRHDFNPFKDPQFSLPEITYYYGCRYLQVLNLNSCNLGDYNFNGFFVLRNVSLTRIGLLKEALVNLVTNCPLLEVLNLIDCRNLYHIDISDLHFGLKRLIVRDCQPLALGIDLCAPNLRYFEYFGHMVTFYLDKLVSLVEAVVDFGFQKVFHNHGAELFDLLLDLFHAKALTVCSYLLKILPTEDYFLFQLPWPLINLKHLTLKTTLDKSELVGVLCLLRSSPKLQTLSIRTCFSWSIGEFSWQPFHISLSHLKTVEVEDFQGSVNEIRLLKLLLQTANALENMIIIPHPEFTLGVSAGDESVISRIIDDLMVSDCAAPHVSIAYRLDISC